MFLVAVTGGIASGKSTVCKMLADLGCPLIDADQIARQVVEPGQPSWKKIRQYFGDTVFLPDGTLDRDKLGQIIFSDSDKRSLLNSLTHPEIYRVILHKLIRFFLQGEPFVVLDLPLLFESGKMLPYINTIVVVCCPTAVQLERLYSRSGLDTTSAQRRIDAQMPLEDKCRRATVVIENVDSMADLEIKVNELYLRLRNSKAHWKMRLLIACVLGGFTASTFYLLRTIYQKCVS